MGRTDGGGEGDLVSFTDDREASGCVNHPAFYHYTVFSVHYVYHVVVRTCVCRFVEKFYFLYRTG